MFITAEILKKYNACDQGLRYVSRFYPKGAEIIELIRDRHINKDFLHWGREHLTLTEEEQEAYREVCKIINTEGYWYSIDVCNSKNIVRSKSVKNSVSIFDSSDIESSMDLINSDNVKDSIQVFHSFMIDKSQKVLKSKNIIESNNICNSTMVVRGKNINNSFNIFDSSEIVDCNTVFNSHFCKRCKNIKFCLFCEGIENAEYYIFNQPFTKEIFELIAKQYHEHFTECLDFVQEWPSKLLSSNFTPIICKFDTWYHSLSKTFWRWVITVPGFDSMIMYNITLFPEVLLD